jgi:hypothetical protein
MNGFQIAFDGSLEYARFQEIHRDTTGIRPLRSEFRVSLAMIVNRLVIDVSGARGKCH